MSKLTNCLLNKDSSCFPIWFMRQAGRYLPEFRKIRSQNSDFIKLCLDSDLSSEITLQPIKRFKLDAAIVFSDILMVPYGLGQEVKFIKNKGPVLSKFNLDKFLNNSVSNFIDKLDPVYKTIKKVRKKLSNTKSLISFIGAPWTLVVYMFDLKKNNNDINLEKLKENKTEIQIVIDKLNEYLCAHLENQVNSGADVIQVFDSWAGIIPYNELYNYCYSPNKKIVEFCKKIKIPVISFPKGINKNYLTFAEEVNPDCLSLDYNVDPVWARSKLKNFCLQGGIDPKVLFKTESEIYSEVDRYLNIFKGTPYIFNLGHGLLPETNPDILEKIIQRVINFK